MTSKTPDEPATTPESKSKRAKRKTKPELFSIKRLTAFADGVVAIAITLLILPLMDRASELGREGKTVLEYLATEFSGVLIFVVSFALISVFWVDHHRVYDRVRRTTSVLTWLTIAWMLTIVWLPVATSMLGATRIDLWQTNVYFGSVILTELSQLGIRVYLLRHPRLHKTSAEILHIGIYRQIFIIILLALALILGITLPTIEYASSAVIIFFWPIVLLVPRIYRAIKARAEARAARSS